MNGQPNRALVDILLEEADPVVRSRAHVELAQRALSTDNVPKAVLHYTEALELDPTDEVSRDTLARLYQKPSGFLSRLNPFR